MHIYSHRKWQNDVTIHISFDESPNALQQSKQFIIKINNYQKNYELVHHSYFYYSYNNNNNDNN